MNVKRYSVARNRPEMNAPIKYANKIYIYKALAQHLFTLKHSSVNTMQGWNGRGISIFS